MAPAIYLSTVCGDGRLPWSSSTPPGERGPLLDQALASLGSGAFGGLGTWAAKLGSAYDCLPWPAERDSGTDTTANPNVPVPALSGDDDIRTPAFEAKSVVARFPDAHLLQVANVGHSVLTEGLSACVISAVRAWLAGATPTTRCSSPRVIAPLPAFPTNLSARTQTHAQRVALVRETLRDAEASWMLAFAEGGGGVLDLAHALTVPGLHSGKLVARGLAFTLTDYGLGGGVTLSGSLTTSVRFNQSFHFDGLVSVRHDGMLVGTLYLDGGDTTGILDDRPLTS